MYARAHTRIYVPALHGNLYTIRIYVYRVGLNRGTKKMFGQCHTAQRRPPLVKTSVLYLLPRSGDNACVTLCCEARARVKLDGVL